MILSRKLSTLATILALGGCNDLLKNEPDLCYPLPTIQRAPAEEEARVQREPILCPRFDHEDEETREELGLVGERCLPLERIVTEKQQEGQQIQYQFQRNEDGRITQIKKIDSDGNFQILSLGYTGKMISDQMIKLLDRFEYWTLDDDNIKILASLQGKIGVNSIQPEILTVYGDHSSEIKFSIPPENIEHLLDVKQNIKNVWLPQDGVFSRNQEYTSVSSSQVWDRRIFTPESTQDLFQRVIEFKDEKERTRKRVILPEIVRPPILHEDNTLMIPGQITTGEPLAICWYRWAQYGDDERITETKCFTPLPENPNFGNVYLVFHEPRGYLETRDGQVQLSRSVQEVLPFNGVFNERSGPIRLTLVFPVVGGKVPDRRYFFNFHSDSGKKINIKEYGAERGVRGFIGQRGDIESLWYTEAVKPDKIL